MEKIYRTYAETQVEVLHTQIKCPNCGMEWLEEDVSTPGETYTLGCDEFDDGCGTEFEMYFDVD
ncbi:hypothetical protein [Sporosarcina psychrophila]|uniref:Transcription elongation factor Elf1 n=1 Tax=Sporosarcina psychrophila TaxID=1476 RepID=A0ABV2K9W4_SPOPS